MVIFVAQDRELKRNWSLTEKNLLRPLEASLAFCGTESLESSEVDYEFKYSEGEPADWRQRISGQGLTEKDILRFEALGPEFFAGISDGKGSGAIVYYWRHQLATKLGPNLLESSFDWFLITRSDLRWTIPHPPVSALKKDRAYFLDGEHYSGLQDRYMLIPKTLLPRFLSLYSPIFQEPEKTLAELTRLDKHRKHTEQPLNPEAFLKHQIQKLGLSRHISFIPYIAFLVRGAEGESRWSLGEWNAGENLFIKYPSEKAKVDHFAPWFPNPQSWGQQLSKFWPPRVLLARMFWFCKQSGLGQTAVVAYILVSFERIFQSMTTQGRTEHYSNDKS